MDGLIVRASGVRVKREEAVRRQGSKEPLMPHEKREWVKGGVMGNLDFLALGAVAHGHEHGGLRGKCRVGKHEFGHAEGFVTDRGMQMQGKHGDGLEDVCWLGGFDGGCARATGHEHSGLGDECGGMWVSPLGDECGGMWVWEKPTTAL